MSSKIIATGKALPHLTITNDELANLIETDDEWISTRTGIRSRRIATDLTSLDLSYASCAPLFGLDATDRSIDTRFFGSRDIDPESIDLIIFASITPDTIVPAMACNLRAALGCSHAIAFDLNAACSGFVYALSVADSMMRSSHGPQAPTSNTVDRALIICTERLTRLVDWQDRNTCVLFGDGSGSCILEWTDDDKAGIISYYLQNEDDDTHALTAMNGFSSLIPFSEEGVVYDEELLASIYPDGVDPKNVDYRYIHGLPITSDPAQQAIDESMGIPDPLPELAPREVIRMDGKKIFTFASKILCHDIEVALEDANLTIDDVKFIIPHQANERIIRFAAKRLGLDMDMFQLSIQDCGNTSSASVPMALTDALLDAGIQSGDVIVVVAFGGGLTSGAAVIRL